MRSRSFLRVLPVSNATFTPMRLAMALIDSMCCVARISVGAMMHAW